ncbi:MAG: hypothetical protein ACREX0_04005 [Noviherbaspirillum sp.]
MRLNESGQLPNMQESRLTNLSSLSPHKLFQELRKAVEADNCVDARQLVDALVHMLRGNQILASSAIRELIGFAQRRKCQPEIVKTLTRLPGFAASIMQNQMS